MKPKIERTIKPKVVSGSIKSATGHRDLKYGVIPIKEWTSGFLLDQAIQEFISNNSPPWTHAKLALHLGVFTVKNLYALMDKGPDYRTAIDKFNCQVEDHLVNGALHKIYHAKMVDLYLKTYISKYTELPPKRDTATKIQMVFIQNKDDLRLLMQDSEKKIGDLLEAASQPTLTNITSEILEENKE